MRKLYAAAAVLMLAALALTGCNNKTEVETTSSDYTTDASYQQEILTDAYTENNYTEYQSVTDAETQSQSAVQTETSTDSTGAPDTAEPSSAEAATQAVVNTQPSSPATTQQSSSQNTAPSAPAQNQTPSSSQSGAVSAPANNEYDIVRSGNFYIKGYMIESNGTRSPLEMAVTDDSVYMLSEFSEGVDIGMLVKNEKMYMIYPKDRIYLEMNDTVMSMAGLSADDLVGSKAVDFKAFKPLTDAYHVIDETVNGVSCRVYSIKDDDGEVKVYMNGSKLIRFASYSETGEFLTATEVDSISGSVPSDKSAPPAEYKRYKGVTGMFSFMTALESQM